MEIISTEPGGMIDPSVAYLIEIGHDVTFARGVVVLAHDASLKQHLGIVKLGRVSIGDNVFVGANSVILAGVTVGDNSIIGAGSVITHDVEANSVYAGNPATKICSLEEYLNKTKERMQIHPYYDRNFRFGTDISNSNRYEKIKNDLKKYKYGYGETHD